MRGSSLLLSYGDEGHGFGLPLVNRMAFFSYCFFGQLVSFGPS